MIVQDDIDAAVINKNFILLTQLPEYESHVTISDAQNIWMTEPDIVFQAYYRLAGTEPDLSATLYDLGFEEDAIPDIMKDIITHKNYSENKNYSEEMTSYNEFRRSVVSSNLNVPERKLSTLISELHPESGQATKIGTKNRGTVSLFERVLNVPEGKVLDVSALTMMGTGARVIFRPDPKRGKKQGSPNFPIVSSDIEHYIMAMKMLPGGPTRYEEDIQYVNAKLTLPRDSIIPEPPHLTLEEPQQAPTFQAPSSQTSSPQTQIVSDTQYMLLTPAHAQYTSREWKRKQNLKLQTQERERINLQKLVQTTPTHTAPLPPI